MTNGYQLRETNYRRSLITRAKAEIGVREKTGNNDGERVEEYLAAARLRKGSAYCAAFITWLFKQEGFSRPHTGWSPALFPVTRLARSALPSNIIGIYFPELKRIAHVGMIERVDGDYYITVEANTSLLGGREGEGVFRRRRHIKMIHAMADWVGPEINKKN